MSLEIDYTSEGFPSGSPVTNGDAVLSTTWDELLWAAVTVGRPNRQYVFRYGNASMYEAVFRWSLVRMALEQRTQDYLCRTDAARTLDPSEKGAVNYFLGMTFCKLFCARLLNAPWALHLDVFRPQLNPVLTGRSRPDLVAMTNTNDWIALESKGRISLPSAEVKDKAKEQAKRLMRVNGVPPRFHIGCITYFRDDVLQFFWRDPKPAESEPNDPIETKVYDGLWRYYYQPVFELIHSHSHNFTEMLRGKALLPIEELDIAVGIHPLIFEVLSQARWGDAKQICQENATLLHHDGYRPDGIRIAAGKSWSLPFNEFEVTVTQKS